MRTLEEMADAIRKDAKGRKELVGKVLGAVLAQQALNNPERWKETISGDLAIGIPSVKQEPKLPKRGTEEWSDRKSTRLNSSHVKISYAVFCLKKKKK